MNKLTKRQQEGAEFLKKFADALASGDTIEFTDNDLAKLREIGVEINFIIHKKVDTLVKGKTKAYERLITNAPWYIRGKSSLMYLPFQVKKLKPEKATV